MSNQHNYIQHNSKRNVIVSIMTLSIAIIEMSTQHNDIKHNNIINVILSIMTFGITINEMLHLV
jgi:hypothetical protein